MMLWMIVKVALKSLAANKLRSVLAMLGIIIGVGAVISMLAIGAGAKKSIMDRMSAMGTNLLIVRPGQRGSMGVMSGTQQNLTLEDAEALLGVEGVHAIAPVVGGSGQIKYLNKNTRSSLVGTTLTYFTLRDFKIEKGQKFTDLDADRMARVAVIGPVTATNLFGDIDPIDKVIKINGINFRVIGVMKSKGDQGWFNPDDQIIIPHTTAMKQVLGQDRLREIAIQAEEGGDLAKVQEDIASLIRKRHRVQPGMPDTIDIRNQAAMLEEANAMSRTFTVLLGGIAGISLLVGGIGIMNIMLVTVTERTREIGVRKAIGAKNKDILSQFLLESLLMSGIGGLLGVAMGVGGARLLPMLLPDFQSLVEPFSIILALSFSAAVGVFFGFYPAWRAAKLDPIEALRHE
ncbi:MAG TPA: ABC transporter permease [Phycisphaerales bacterium]|nr:ABC transporter permease [Phycisphaerales bacterium]